MVTRTPRAPKRLPTDPVVTDFEVAIDTREQAPWDFRGLKADADQGRRPLLVRVQMLGLPTGDYSLIGHHDRVAIERKSLQDLYGTIGQGRERFERELERLQSIADQPGGHAAVIVEASWEQALWRPCPTCQGIGRVAGENYEELDCTVCGGSGRLHPVEHSRLSPKTVFRSVNAWELRYPGVHWHFMGPRELAQQKAFRLLERWWETVGSQSAG